MAFVRDEMMTACVVVESWRCKAESGTGLEKGFRLFFDPISWNLHKLLIFGLC